MGDRLVIRGPLLPDKSPLEEEDEDKDGVVEEDEEDEPLFVDAEELCNGGLRSGSLPSRCRVIIEDENTTEKIRVFGRFSLVDPWWKVKVKVKLVGSRYLAHGLPSYFLRTDLLSNHKDICALFLKACEFPDDFRLGFLKWVYGRSSYCNLSFANLQEALKDFEEEWQKESSGEKGRNSSQEKKNQSLSNKNPTALKTVMTALKFPRIMEFIPILLPRHFHNLLNLEHPESLFRDLEEILNTCPWKLGFSRVKYSFYSWQRTNQKLEDKIPWKFSSVKVLVVDEGSLVCIAVFRSVLNLLRKHARLVKLIILGDIRQLPSIEPGNLLMDLFETLRSRNCAVELKTNHRAESQLIVDNAARISRRQFPKFDAELTISDGLADSIPDQNKRFIFVRLPEDSSHSQSSQRNYCSYLYSAVKTLLNGAVELKKPKTSQFIAFRKQDCDIINECCCSFYSGHLTKNHKNRLVFQKDDKICCTRNAYLSDLLPENSNSLQNENLELGHDGDVDASYHGKKSKKSHGSESDIRLCNGEIFYITDDVQNENGRFLTINNLAGLEVTVDFKKLVNFCHIRHAWARTIHTFQGSEEDTVVYVIGKAGRQHWQHVYTAITRGRSRVYVIAEESQLRKAVKQSSFPRNTRLRHFLQRNFAYSCTFPTEGSFPSKSHGQSKGHSSQPSATPLDPNIPGTFANSFIKTCDSVDEDVTLITNRGEKMVSFEETDEEEDSLELRGTKRSTINDFESPNKLLLVEPTSPFVSARLQNMTLNSLTPKQLFKTTVSEGT
ncbi:DNA helicase B isoform X2 [Vombatus ursinus]|uniref:DNA helicase B isoform X2 n=1 Tax=Vombatus ursinus TaxID=29139 RepID=UPI000FFCF02E|nr:DNA helicase B isoform X2 [Vombatus ursinus]